MHASRRPMWLCALLAALVVTGCPRRFDPRADEIHSNNPEAEADYKRARQQWQQGDYPGAEDTLKRFTEKYGQTANEPLLPLATLLQARVQLSTGQPARAKELIAPLLTPPAGAPPTSPAIQERARYELGLAEYRLGAFAEARTLLQPFSTQIIDGDESTELHAILADLWNRTGPSGATAALQEYELFYRGSGVRSVEQAYIRQQVAPLIARLPKDQQRGLRQRFAIEESAQTAEAAPGRVPIGLVLPLSGRDRQLGERVLRGALWGAGLLGSTRPGSGGNVELRVRDSGSGADNAAAAVVELAREGVSVVVGTPAKGAEATQVAAQAERSGLVMLQLSSQAAAGGRTFQLLRSNTARAQSLAQQLLRSGMQTVAVLAPNTSYGQSMTKAFVDALSGPGGRGAPPKVVAQLTFPEGATTFTAQGKQLQAAQPQALFVPASAAQLELIASQLAAIGVLGTQRVTQRREGQAEPSVRLVLASAEGMGERLLRNAGRYLQGAVLAPVSIGGAPIDDAGETARFEGFKQQVGAEPGALDALGYDAVRLVRAGCGERAVCTSEQLTGALRALGGGSAAVDGATGALAFDATGQRTGSALLLRVDGTSLRPIR